MRGREFLVGLVIIVSVAIAVIGTLWLQGRTFGPVRTATVLAESVGQLGEGNAITYRGVRIGQVQSISVLDDGSGVVVTLLLREAVPLPSDPAVVFGPESLFGDWQAEIVSRDAYPSFPFYDVPDGFSPPATVGAALPVLGGYALPELSRLSASAEQIATNLESLTDRLELAFNEETASSLSTAISNIQAITEEVRTLVAQQGQVAASITANADSALAEIGVAAGAARRTFERVDEMMDEGEVEALFADLREVASNLRGLSGELADSTGLGATLTSADSAFTRLNRIAARIESGEGSLGRLLSDGTLAIRAEDALAQLDSLLADLRENPQRYLRLSIF